VIVGVSEPRKQALIAASQAVPNPIQLRALLDTGASHTCVVRGTIAPLGLSPTGQGQMSTPSTGSAPAACDVYDVSLIIIHPALSKLISAMPIIECGPLAGPYEVLLGRDLLAHCLLVYNGPSNAVSLAI
jgi:hypothetical protein